MQFIIDYNKVLSLLPRIRPGASWRTGAVGGEAGEVAAVGVNILTQKRDLLVALRG